MSPRTVRILVVGYVAKSLILGAAWLMVPDLPQKAAAKVRQVFSRAADQPEGGRP